MTDRRSFLRGSSVLLGSAMLGDVLAAFAASPRKATFFTDDEMQALSAVVDLILPATDSPSASTAGTHYFIDLAIPACASEVARRTFRDAVAGMATSGFAGRPDAEQVAWLKERAAVDLPLEYDQSFFKILKDYTL